MRKLVILLPMLLAFTWTDGQRLTATHPEQQAPGVVNPRPAPGGCAWDPDDHMDKRGAGDLAAGESTEWHECLFADWLDHAFSVQVLAKISKLRVEVGWSNPDGSRSYVVVGVPAAQKMVRYDTCFRGPEYDNGSPLLPVVEGSNGGFAQETDLFVRITNTGTRTARDVSALVQVHLATACPDLSREDVIPGQLWWFRP